LLADHERVVWLLRAIDRLIDEAPIPKTIIATAGSQGLDVGIADLPLAAVIFVDGKWGLRGDARQRGVRRARRPGSLGS
jgi:hypothetical protein